MSTTLPAASSRILIVDDTPANIQTLTATLKGKGYQISVAMNGKQALDVLARMHPDLILLDVMMPEINGYDICSNLKFDDKFKHIPIIVLTSREQELDPKIGRLMGIDYMQKPIDTKILLEKIQSALKS